MERIKNKKVDFFCVGVQKAGTSTLHTILKNSPEIFLPEGKETKFFVDEDLYNKGYEYYFRTSYSNAKEKLLLGEVDPEYIYFPKVAQRLSIYNVYAKIIIIFRNPIDRAYSHYLMSKSRGFEKHDFLTALTLEKERLNCGSWLDRVHYSYCDRGFYSKQLSRYLDFFPRERIFIMFFEDLINDSSELMKDLAKFIGVGSVIDDFNSIKKNTAIKSRSRLLSKMLYGKSQFRRRISRYFPKCVKTPLTFIRRMNQSAVNSCVIPPEAVNYLKELYAEDISELSRITTRDLSIWLQND